VTDDEKLIAWAAGLFEGEGSLFAAKQNRPDRPHKIYVYQRMSVTSTDLDVLEKFQDVVQCGLIHFSRRAKLHHKDVYHWVCNNSNQTMMVVQAFWPYLGERRKQQAAEIGLNF